MKNEIFSEFGKSPAAYSLTEVLKEIDNKIITKKIRRTMKEIDFTIKEVMNSNINKKVKMNLLLLALRNRLEYIKKIFELNKGHFCETLSCNVIHTKFTLVFKELNKKLGEK